MRIAGYMEHPGMKITIFQMDNRFSVKFETGLYEQTYKFRSGENINSPEEVKKIIDAPFLQSVSEIFVRMHQAGLEAMNRNIHGAEEEAFEDII